MMDQDAESFGRGRTGDFGHVVWNHVMAFSDLDDRIDGALRAVGARIGFECDPRLQEPKMFAELLAGLFRTQCTEEAACLIENLWIRGKSRCRKLCRHDPVARRVAQMEWFHHSAKVLAQPRRQRGGDSECNLNLLRPEAKNFSCSSSGTQRAAYSGGMKAYSLRLFSHAFGE